MRPLSVAPRAKQPAGRQKLGRGRPAARVQPPPERRRFLEPPTEADLDEQRLYLIPATLTRGPNSHRLPTDVAGAQGEPHLLNLTSEYIYLHSVEKGKKHDSTVFRILLSLLSYLEVLEFGLSAARAQAPALRNFTAARAAVYPTATHFFELPGERFTEKTNFGDALGRMLGTALTTVSLQPPEGRVYTARSLRSGGASAAEMVPLPRSKIEFLGGWAVDSKRLSQHYISRATPPTYAGRFFFDWLILPLADNMALDFPS
ncbi:core-binding (CB) domain-containing protein [Pycnococcus provasolii]